MKSIDHELSPKVLIPVAIVVGIFFGYLIRDFNPYIEYQVEYVESWVGKTYDLNSSKFTTFVNGGTTLADYQRLYWQYQPVSGALLRFQINRVCALRSRAQINLTNCSQVCDEICIS